MLWAWERPGDLRNLPETAGVAFLAATISIRQSGVHVIPRFQPLRLSPGVYRMAVVRIEPEPSLPELSATLIPTVLNAIADTVRATRPDAVQVDFDARVSERPFYAALLRQLRAHLGDGVFLS